MKSTHSANQHLTRAQELLTEIQKRKPYARASRLAHSANISISQAMNELDDIAQDQKELRQALHKVLPRVEKWERANLTEHEGRPWPVEIMRAEATEPERSKSE
jgi:DNA repair ATPase RecN